MSDKLVGIDEAYQKGYDDCVNKKYISWISVKDRLPNHDQIILVFAKTKRGVNVFGVATFVDSIKMNEELKKSPYANECVDIIKHPYYFVSQEVRQHTFNNVSHWMPLPGAPE